jgi:hypothetical protein
MRPQKYPLYFVLVLIILVLTQITCNLPFTSGSEPADQAPIESIDFISLLTGVYDSEISISVNNCTSVEIPVVGSDISFKLDGERLIFSSSAGTETYTDLGGGVYIRTLDTEGIYIEHIELLSDDSFAQKILINDPEERVFCFDAVHKLTPKSGGVIDEQPLPGNNVETTACNAAEYLVVATEPISPTETCDCSYSVTFTNNHPSEGIYIMLYSEKNEGEGMFSTGGSKSLAPAEQFTWLSDDRLPEEQRTCPIYYIKTVVAIFDSDHCHEYRRSNFSEVKATEREVEILCPTNP